MRQRHRSRPRETVCRRRPAAAVARSRRSLASWLTVALLAGCPAPVLAATWVPLAELRVRQEILDGVYHFAPEPDRNWLRVRTSAGVRFDQGPHRAVVVLRNEHRHYLTPADVAFDWSELFLDQAYWSLQAGAGPRLTLGRQNIVWPGGLLMLDGNPLAGSRSMFHNAARVQTTAGSAVLDLAVIHNPRRDPVVLAGDQHLALTDADETALAVRLDHGRWAWSAILLREHDPDDLLAEILDTATLGGRLGNRPGATLTWYAELAVQHQRDRRRQAPTPVSPPPGDPDAGAATLPPYSGPEGWAIAADLAATWPLRGRRDATLGAFYYSGRDADRRPFRTPWGRWPKWSELYIYTLIGESTGGRIHAAAWQNIAAPHVTLAQRVGKDLTTSVGASWLLAPAPRWQERGWLTRAELAADLGARLQGHLRWEMLLPGSFHDGRGGLPPLTRTVHFLRWQMSVSL
jgi:hypothetical protein